MKHIPFEEPEFKVITLSADDVLCGFSGEEVVVTSTSTSTSSGSEPK